jgi:surface protein
MSRQKNQEGFSLLEMVVAMGILIVLVIGGILFYRGINQNSKEAAVQQAAKSVYTGAVANQSDNDGSTTPSSAAKEYNESQKDTITVDGVDRPVIYVTVDEFTDGGLKVKAVYGDDEAEHIIDTSRSTDTPVVTDPNEEPIVNTVSNFTYQCDRTITGRLPFINVAEGTTVTVFGSDGSEQKVNYVEANSIDMSTMDSSFDVDGNDEWFSFSWQMGDATGITTPRNISDLVEMKAGVEYEVIVDGSYEALDTYLTWNTYSNLLSDCLTTVDSFGDGIKSIHRFAGDKLTDVPDTIPSSVTSMRAAFMEAGSLRDPDLGKWTTDNVTDMAFAFSMSDVKVNLNEWTVSKVTNMGGMFEYNESFDSPLNQWDVSNVRNMSSMFKYSKSFNQPLDDWTVSNVKTMNGMFSSASVFDQNIDNWDVSQVERMDSMFDNATVFNQPLNGWKDKTAKVANMKYMFRNASQFNQPLHDWNVSNVTDMTQMFHGANSFNQDISTWDVSNVVQMGAMFGNMSGYHAFNQNLSGWNVQKVTSYHVINANLTEWKAEHMPKIKRW